MKDICPNYEVCPIFTGVLKHKDFTTKAYKSQYCEAGVKGRTKCLRWHCKQKYGKVPANLLPNVKKTLDEIARENNYL